MVLLEGPYFIDLAKLYFKVIANYSSGAELCAWTCTSMAPGQHFSHHRSKLSVERQPASKSDGSLKSTAKKSQRLKCSREEGHNVTNPCSPCRRLLFVF